jgi:hypothetical protein
MQTYDNAPARSLNVATTMKSSVATDSEVYLKSSSHNIDVHAIGRTATIYHGIEGNIGGCAPSNNALPIITGRGALEMLLLDTGNLHMATRPPDGILFQNVGNTAGEGVMAVQGDMQWSLNDLRTRGGIVAAYRAPTLRGMGSTLGRSVTYATGRLRSDPSGLMWIAHDTRLPVEGVALVPVQGIAPWGTPIAIYALGAWVVVTDGVKVVAVLFDLGTLEEVTQVTLLLPPGMPPCAVTSAHLAVNDAGDVKACVRTASNSIYEYLLPDDVADASDVYTSLYPTYNAVFDTLSRASNGEGSRRGCVVAWAGDSNDGSHGIVLIDAGGGINIARHTRFK